MSLIQEAPILETKEQTQPHIFQDLTCLIMFCLIFSLIYIPLANAEPAGKVIARDGSFQKLSSNLIVDTKLGLMWAQADNGSKVSLEEARAYIDNFSANGYTDWRFPTIQELETLMVKDLPNNTPPSNGCSGNYEIHHFFQLTCCCPWALQDNGTRPATYPFIKGIATGSMWHHKSNKLGNRALPVRDIK